ncbi:StsA family sactipeptide RiPP [Kitasatospora sp. NPDC002227]
MRNTWSKPQIVPTDLEVIDGCACACSGGAGAGAGNSAEA